MNLLHIYISMVHNFVNNNDTVYTTFLLYIILQALQITVVLSPTPGSPDDRKCENAERNRNEAGHGLPIEDPYLCGRNSWVHMISEIAWNSAKSLILSMQDEIISRVDMFP